MRPPTISTPLHEVISRSGLSPQPFILPVTMDPFASLGLSLPTCKVGLVRNWAILLAQASFLSSPSSQGNVETFLIIRPGKHSGILGVPHHDHLGVSEPQCFHLQGGTAVTASGLLGRKGEIQSDPPSGRNTEAPPIPEPPDHTPISAGSASCWTPMVTAASFPWEPSWEGSLSRWKGSGSHLNNGL